MKQKMTVQYLEELERRASLEKLSLSSKEAWERHDMFFVQGNEEMTILTSGFAMLWGRLMQLHMKEERSSLTLPIVEQSCQEALLIMPSCAYFWEKFGYACQKLLIEAWQYGAEFGKFIGLSSKEVSKIRKIAMGHFDLKSSIVIDEYVQKKHD